MTRREGTQGVTLVECLNRRKQTYAVRTDVQAAVTEESPNGVTFIEQRFDHKPSMEEVKEFVLGVINAKTDEKILSGFVWNGKPVWLSAESQTNFSAAEYTASTKNGLGLPVTFKLGEQDGTPVYHEFTTVEELSGFYLLAQDYIKQCLGEGWQEKDSIDWTPYEQALNV